MRKLALALAFALAACSAGPRLPKAAQGAPVLEVRGAVKQGPFALGRADLRALPRRTLRGMDPETGKTATFAGTAVAALVSDRVQLLRGADTSVARTADGAAIPIPLVEIRRLKPVLADEVDGTRLSTPVIAWPTLDAPGLATDPRAAGWWAKGVVAFEIVSWQRAFSSALATAEGAPDGARRGAAAFAERCISCHRVRGVGGTKGPELTAVTGRMRAEPFSALLADHPGAPPADGERSGSEVTAEVWSFLRAVAASTAAPPEDLAATRGDDFTADRGVREPGRQ